MKKVFFVLLLTFLFSNQAFAYIVSYDFTGSVYSVSDSGNALSGSIQSSMPFSGSFYYDTSTLTQYPNEPHASYSASPSTGYISVNIGGYSFRTKTDSSIGIGVNNNSRYDPIGADIFGISSINNIIPANMGYLSTNEISLNFTDLTGTVFTNELPPTSFDGKNFSLKELTIFGMNSNVNLRITGNIENVTSTIPTPIPAGAWLFGSGLVGLVGLRKKKN